MLKYIKRAFNVWGNYVFLGLGVLAGAFIHWGIFLVLAGLELGYLYFRVSDQRYRRHVDSRLLEERVTDVEEFRSKLWPLLSDDARQGYQELSVLADKLDAADITATQKRDPYFKENQRKVKVLLINYLQMGAAVARYRDYLERTNPQQIEQEIAELEGELEGATTRVRSVKQKNIEILQKRRDKVERAEANYDYLRAQMDTIADTMELVVDQAITLSDPKGTGVQIDNLLNNLQTTDELATEMAAYEELQEGWSGYLSIPEDRELE